jgi:hypothetical protein
MCRLPLAALFASGLACSPRSLDSDAMKFASVQSFLRQLSPATRERVENRNLLRLIEPPH